MSARAFSLPWRISAVTFLCFLLSGGTALIYQVAWVRHMTLIFGSTAFAVSTVLTAFMAGLALGSYLLGRWIDRRGSPLLAYAGLEALIGAYALLIPLIFAALIPIYQWVWDQFSPHYYLFSLIRFVLTFLVLMIPTTCMGGTLPILAKFYALVPQGQLSLSVSTLYAVNTFGAVLGVISSGFLLIPTLGLSHSVLTASLINFLLAGLIALVVFTAPEELREFLLRPLRASRSPQPSPVPTRSLPVHGEGQGGVEGGRRPGEGRLRAYVLFSFAMTGFAALALEVAWTRVLSLVLGPSVYAFSVMLSTFLVGLAAGAFAFSRLIEAFKLDGLRTLSWLQLLIGAATFLTLLLFNQLPFLFATIFHRWGASQSTEVLFGLEFLLCFLVMYLPTFFMGGIFPAVVQIFSAERGAAGRTIGRIYAANTVGAILGSFSAGFLLIPTIGIQNTVILTIFIYLGLSLVTALFTWGDSRSAAIPRWSLGRIVGSALSVATILVVVFFSPDWNRLVMSSGMFQYAPRLKPPQAPEDYIPTRADFDRYVNRLEILFYKEGYSSTITVAKEKAILPRQLGDQMVESILLINDGKIDASSYSDMPTQIFSGHAGLMLHPDPKDVLVIGLASGTTAGSVLQHPIERLTNVEIEEAVVEASRQFDFVNHKPLDDPRSMLIVNDGRNYLLVTPQKYDVIVSEPSNPWMSGPSNLFTQEFFKIVRRKLKDDGIFVQWVQMYSMSPENMRALIATVRSIFPYVYVFNTLIGADLLLVSSGRPVPFDLEQLSERLERESVKRDLARIGITSVAEFLAYFRLGSDEIADLVRGAPLNTDDNALIEFAAPKDLYRLTGALNNRMIAQATRGIAHYLSNLSEGERAEFFRKLSEAYSRRGLKTDAEIAAEAAER
ncbi:fused MFS/spermidine synthase [Candidatus Acetothermia bacterium]|jgi:spermidine synthase|nr:fused MFS/spermidine synthase [Candidatus Acetothermia bacterium]MCI2436146.1 fused MFS/spermidine synthase [Candidatus Acetothermia bacterium]